MDLRNEALSGRTDIYFHGSSDSLTIAYIGVDEASETPKLFGY